MSERDSSTSRLAVAATSADYTVDSTQQTAPDSLAASISLIDRLLEQRHHTLPYPTLDHEQPRLAAPGLPTADLHPSSSNLRTFQPIHDPSRALWPPPAPQGPSSHRLPTQHGRPPATCLQGCFPGPLRHAALTAQPTRARNRPDDRCPYPRPSCQSLPRPAENARSLLALRHARPVPALAHHPPLARRTITQSPPPLLLIKRV